MAEMIDRVTPWPADKMAVYRWLDEYLQKQPGTVKAFQPAWQAYKYLLRGKMYAYIGVHDKDGRPIVTLKLEPAYSELLRREYAGAVIPGYYMNKVHWSSVYLDSELPRDLLAGIVQAAHKTLLSSLSQKAQREILG